MEKIKTIILSICLFVAVVNVAKSQYVWTESASNPVLPSWSGNYDDANFFRYAFEPCVIYDSTFNLYRMWFTSIANYGYKKCISTAISFDGEEWFVNAKNPVFKGITDNFDGEVRSPRVIHDQSEYKMYYTGQKGDTYWIGLAISSDGKTWRNFSNDTTRYAVIQPESSDSWDAVSQHFEDVYYDGSTYYMWFTGIHDYSVARTIGLATSQDGIHWTEYQDNPVFSPSISGWDSASISSPAVVRVEGIFYMFYLGASNMTVDFYIGVVQSVDGIHWERTTPSPVLSRNSGWDLSSLGNLSVLYRDSVFHLWYSGYNNYDWQTGYARSVRGMVGIGSSKVIPKSIGMEQCYPNPFNPGTTIQYNVTRKDRVSLKVYDILGREVATIVDEEQTPGEKTAVWNASSFASGAYFYRLKVGSFVETKKMVLVR
jgi:predicted GH43/DUF377 family glycosyl hydrolase